VARINPHLVSGSVWFHVWSMNAGGAEIVDSGLNSK